MQRLCALFALLMLAMLPAAAAELRLQTVSAVDLTRYTGRWYEVARFPNRFQQQCVGDVTADYRLRDDGRLDVLNRCRTAHDEISAASGLARVVDKVHRAKLKVRFAPEWLSWLPMVWGDYWIVALADDYRYAAITAPSGDYLWILSRQPQLTDADLAQIRQRLTAMGLDLSRLQSTSHTSPPANTRTDAGSGS